MPSSDVPVLTPTNRLLAALPPVEFHRLTPYLEPFSLQAEVLLHEAGQPISHVYFPSGGIICLLRPPDNTDGGIEIGVVGREGMAGLAVFLGMETTPVRCMVQLAGECLRMRAEDFHNQVSRDSQLHGLLLRYTHVFLAQVSVSLACNVLHSIEQRLCRWLLAVHGRVGDGQFRLTQEMMATMLGVRRASVTTAARHLRDLGLIQYERGQVTVLNRPGLEGAACDCHSIVQAEFDRLPG